MDAFEALLRRIVDEALDKRQQAHVKDVRDLRTDVTALAKTLSDLAQLVQALDQNRPSEELLETLQVMAESGALDDVVKICVREILASILDEKIESKLTDGTLDDPIERAVKALDFDDVIERYLEGVSFDITPAR